MAASSNTQSYAEILQSIKKRQLAPVYILGGEESFLIDQLAKAFESIIAPEERDFNFYALYAPEVTPELVAATCRRFPMMSERQVVIVKEAQSVRSDILNKLGSYCEHPTESTVLVICFRGEKAKGKDLLAKAKDGGAIFFESKKLTEKTIDPFLTNLIHQKQLNIEPKGLSMLRDYIGLDVAKIYNEIDKLAFILGPGAMITPEAIERNVGISKDFNNFELIDAIAARDAQKAFRIVNYFRSNPKKNPAILTGAAIFNFFSALLSAQFTRDKSPSALMAAVGAKWPSQMTRYNIGLRNYNAYRSIEIISAIREFDTKSKGVGSRQNEYDLLHDLVFKILTCSGKVEYNQ